MATTTTMPIFWALCLGTLLLLTQGQNSAAPHPAPALPASPPTPPPPPAVPDSWCIAQRKASMKLLQYQLDWVCGPAGQADCAPIQPGAACFLPDNAHGHASYAFNSYYQKNHRAPGACNFSFLATVVYKDPSYPPCYYPKAP